jgi:hypothetical protein
VGLVTCPPAASASWIKLPVPVARQKPINTAEMAMGITVILNFFIIVMPP